MTLEIQTDSVFQKRLAELAWEEADELTKKTLAGNIAFQFTSQKGFHKQFVDKVYNTIGESLFELVRNDERFLKALDSAVNSIVEKTNSGDIKKHAETVVTTLACSVCEESVETLVNGSLRKIDFDKEIKQSVPLWIQSKVEQYLNGINDSLTFDERQALLELVLKITE